MKMITLEEVRGRVEKFGGAKKSKIHSPTHALAEEISVAFGEPKKFGLYLGLIIRIGLFESRKIFSELKQNYNLDNQGRAKIFMAASRKKKC